MPRTMTQYTHYNFTDKDPIIDRLRTIIKGMQLSWKEVSEMTGVSYGTLYGMFMGKTISPRFSTVARIVIGLGKNDLPVTEQKKQKAKVIKFPGRALPPRQQRHHQQAS